MPTRVLIVEDGGFTADALRSLLELLPDLTVVGAVTNCAEALAAARETQPQLVLLDLRIKDTPIGTLSSDHGLAALSGLMQLEPAPRVLVLTSLPEQPWLHIVARAGALGFVSKDASSAAIVVAVRSLCAGGVAFTSAQLQLLQQRAPRLSKREREVLALLTEGLSNQQIAETLGISAGTARKHVENLCSVFGVHSRGQVVAAARRQGLLVAG